MESSTKGPLDWSGKFNTQLHPAAEKLFQYHAQSIPQLQNSKDYDSRGWWMKQMSAAGNKNLTKMLQNPQSSLKYMQGRMPNPNDKNSGHFEDTFKKPNHPTFSTGSQYHGVGGYTGGEWTQTSNLNSAGNNIWHYTPSQTNIDLHGHDGLHSYWNRVEAPNGHVLNLQKSFFSFARWAPLTKSETPAWQREEGKNPKGGLNAKGRASAKAEGHNLKPPVLHAKNLSEMKRQYSFLSRMSGNPGPEYDEKGKPTRLLLSLKVWGANSKAEAKKKAASLKRRIEAMEQ